MATSKLRTVAVDTSNTNPEAFLTGGGSPPVLSGPPAASPPPAPEDQESSSPPAPQPPASLAATPQVVSDPFVLISRAGSTERVARSLRAMAVPGGVVLKSSFAVAPDPTPRSESMCFIPGIEVKDITAMINQPEI